ncbi:MAG: DUF3341 domain-containing protein [Bernardetiaceae bacterium]|nr:DUF3341 domain-containing protein [Bernardetiaceae bacterium]
MELNKHFVVGVFDDEDTLADAITFVKEKGIKIHEVFTPYPIHGLEHKLGYKHSWLPTAAFLFGATGTTLALIMQIGMLGVDWPMIIGGKPFIAVPDFIPVTFEMTVLLAAFGMVGSFLVSQDMKPHKVPRIFDRRATDDKFIMAIDLAENTLGEEQLKEVLKEAGTEEGTEEHPAIFRKDFTDEENNPSFIGYVRKLFSEGVLANDTSRPVKS